MIEFVCNILPIAAGEQAELLCAAVLAQTNASFADHKGNPKPSKVVLTVHVADNMGSEATLKLHDSAGHTRETARLGVTTTDNDTPAQHSERLATMLLDDLN